MATDEMISAIARGHKIRTAKAAVADDAVTCPRCGGSNSAFRDALSADWEKAIAVFLPWVWFMSCPACHGYGRVSPKAAENLRQAIERKRADEVILDRARQLRRR